MKIAIVGGGASGLMAAASILEEKPDAELYIFENSDALGKKILLTGGGRCNLTTSITDVNEVLKNYPRGSRFLKFAMHKFSPQDTFEWFEKHHVPLKTETTMKVYPRSDSAHDIINVFLKIIKNSTTKVILNCENLQISVNDGHFKINYQSDKKEYFDKIIICTGSSPEGYNYSRILGHTITDLAPGLTSIRIDDENVKNFSGISFKQSKISVFASKKYCFTGDFLFTHKGVSGPGIFAIASMSAYENFESKKCKISFDMIPDKNEEELFTEINRQREFNKSKASNFFSVFAAKKIISYIFDRTGIDPDKKVCELSNAEIRKLISGLKSLSFTILGRDKGDEFVRAGGVTLSEIDSKTMQSKICPGLYFAGELLDVDGFTGGFNLQAAWCTGRLAGLSALKSFR